MSRTWFITGATRGIGAEIAKAALAAGDNVAGTGRQAGAVEKAQGASDRLLSLSMDITEPEQVAAGIKAATARFGRIDVLVNNAGYILIGALEECSAEEVETQYRTNVFGLLDVTRAALPTLRAQGAGHIINISSIAGFAADPGASSYAGTKFAVEGLSEALAIELAPLGIAVTIVEPGYFRTDLLADGSSVYADKIIDAYDATSGETRRVTKIVDGKQMGDPAKLAQAILLLTASKSPPRRFVAGADAVELLNQVLQRRKAELEQWRSLSTSLAHDG